MAAHPRPTMGLYDRPFWEHVAAADLRLQRCRSCAAFRYPPGPVCPQCLSPEHDWTALSGTGVVLGWARFHRQYFDELPPPYTVVAVETAEGPVLVGNYLTTTERAPACGDQVHVVYEDVGAAPENWKIPQWQPTEEQHDNARENLSDI